MNSRILRKQQGIALIMAVLIAAMVAALSIALTSRVHLWINQTQNRQDMLSAQHSALAAIDFARLTLRDDNRKNSIDHLQESWTISIPMVAVEEGKVGGRLVEMQGRFNLSNVVKNKQLNRASIEIFQRLLAILGLDVALAENLEKILISHLSKNDRGAGLSFPYQSLEEMSEIPGFDNATIERLRMFVTVLPEYTPINVNFIDSEVLAAMIPQISAMDAQTIVGKRRGRYYKTTADFVDDLPEKVRDSISKDLFSVQSSYFLAEIESWFGRAQLRYHALLERKQRNMPRIVWLRRIYDLNMSLI